MALEFVTTLGQVLTLLLDLGTIIGRAIRIDSQIDDAKVHPKDALNTDLFRLQHITDDGDVEHASDVH